MNRYTIVAAVVAVLALSGAVATVAVDTDEPVERVELAPASGPNGEYAEIGDDGQLDIRIEGGEGVSYEGINPDSRTLIDGVFVVRNERSRPVTVFLRDESDSVTLYAGEERESVEGESNARELAPSETLAVGLRVESAGTQREALLLESIDLVTRVPTPTPGTPPVESPPPGTPPETPPGQGEPPGGGAPGGGGGGGGGGGVGAPPEPRTGDAQVDEVRLLDERIGIDETARIRVDLINAAGAPDDIELTVQEDGTAIGSRTVEVGGVTQSTVRLRYDPTEPGNRTVSVNGREAGVVQVVPRTTSTPGLPGDPIPPELVTADESHPVADTDSEAPGVQVVFETTSVRRITFMTPAEGRVRVRDLRDLPPGDPQPSGQVVQATDIYVPPRLEDQPATVEFAVPADEADAESLRVLRLHDGSWAPVDAQVSRQGDTVRIRASTPGFSRFAVVEQQATATPTPETPTEPDEPTATATGTAVPPTESATPQPDGQGIGPGEVLAALAVLVLLAGGLLGARIYLEEEG
ncbi:hypothetical protein [Haloglomus litoreum]|uniref:hypothetical protein n=1 Tax=Haloglomus litoreum TaxID=3034026 RepID=UPI0023E896C8|nr:hypothetical protein [Haloglomus sp. DT116]